MVDSVLWIVSFLLFLIGCGMVLVSYHAADREELGKAVALFFGGLVVFCLSAMVLTNGLLG